MGARGEIGVRGAREEQEGVREEQEGARGSEGSETNVILGFKAPTTIAGKKFGDHL